MSLLWLLSDACLWVFYLSQWFSGFCLLVIWIRLRLIWSLGGLTLDLWSDSVIWVDFACCNMGPKAKTNHMCNPTLLVHYLLALLSNKFTIVPQEVRLRGFPPQQCALTQACQFVTGLPVELFADSLHMFFVLSVDSLLNVLRDITKQYSESPTHLVHWLGISTNRVHTILDNTTCRKSLSPLCKPMDHLQGQIWPWRWCPMKIYSRG